MSAVLALVFVAVVWILRQTVGDRPKVEDSLAHWHATIPGLVIPPERFYKLLIEALTKLNIPGARVGQVTLFESTFGGYARPYVCVRRSKLVYYIFAAPLGESFFVSSWLLARRSPTLAVLARLPVLGWLFVGLAKLYDPRTMYIYDSALHFNESVHATVLAAVDTLTSKENAPPLAPEARKPVMRELYARPQAPQLAL